MRLKGHKLAEIYCFDTVSMKTHAVCECGWKGDFRSNFRAREAHAEHKVRVSLPSPPLSVETPEVVHK